MLVEDCVQEPPAHQSVGEVEAGQGERTAGQAELWEPHGD